MYPLAGSTLKGELEEITDAKETYHYPYTFVLFSLLHYDSISRSIT